MRCKISDCFNCPFPDCINDKIPPERTPEQKKKDHEKLMQRKQWCRENGVCTQCMCRPATKGYVTCAGCRRNQSRWARERNHRQGLHLPRVLMDGVDRCKICGKNPPMERQTICQRCYENCINNLPKDNGGMKQKNGFSAANSAYWRESVQKKNTRGTK